jgi:bacterioferritin-associated ferredoxin
MAAHLTAWGGKWRVGTVTPRTVDWALTASGGTAIPKGADLENQYQYQHLPDGVGAHAMIVCICRGISDRHLEALVDAGAQTVEQVERLCGAGGDCGACRSEVERIIDCRSLCAPRQTAAALAPALLARSTT